MHSVVNPEVEDAANDDATAGSSAGTAADAGLVVKDEVKDEVRDEAKDEVKDEALPATFDDQEVPSGDGDALKTETAPDEEEVKPPASAAPPDSELLSAHSPDAAPAEATSPTLPAVVDSGQ